MNSSSGLFAASAWTWLWTALVIERASSVAWSPLKRWAATHKAPASSLWISTAEHVSDIGLGLLCVQVLQTAPPLEGLIGLQPVWAAVGVSALVMAGFIDLWRRLLAWPLRPTTRPSEPAPARPAGLSLSSPPSGSDSSLALLSNPHKAQRSFQLGSLSLHRSEP